MYIYIYTQCNYIQLIDELGESAVHFARSTMRAPKALIPHWLRQGSCTTQDAEVDLSVV